MAIAKFACYMFLLITVSLRVCSTTRVYPVPMANMDVVVVAEPSPPIPIPPPPELPIEDQEELITSLNPPSIDELSIAIQRLTHAMKAKCDCQSPFNDNGNVHADLTSAVQGLTFVMKAKCDCSSPLIARDYSQSDLAGAIQELTNEIEAKSTSLMFRNDHA